MNKKRADTIAYMLSYPGWLMVLVGFVTIMAMSWPLMVYKFIYGPVIDEFGWSRTQATMLISYHWVAAALTGFFVVGSLIERIGLRKVVIISQVTMSLALIGFLFIDSRPLYYAMGMLIGFSVSATMISVNVFVSRWFVRNQGMAIGITIIALSVAGSIIPLICEPLIALYGWRITMSFGSIILLFIGIPFYLWKARENPSEADISPELHRSDDKTAMAQHLKDAELELTLQTIFRTPMFWIIVTAIFIVSAVDQGLMQHTILYVQRDLGLGGRTAAYTMSGMFTLGILAKICGGWIYDRISIKGIMLFYFMLAVSVLLAIPIAGPFTVALFAVSRGIAHGGLISEPAIFAKHCYGTKYLNRIMPIMLGGMYAGFASGPIILSTFYDLQGTYYHGLILFGVVSLLAAILLIFVRPLYRERLHNRIVQLSPDLNPSLNYQGSK